jgi:hypothetical protein
MIPVFGKGSQVKVECSNCNRSDRINKKYKKSTSGFLFVGGQKGFGKNQIRTWIRWSENLCYDCWLETWEEEK